MAIPEKFDRIRPFEPEELPAVYERLLANPQFQSVIAHVMPGIPLDAVKAKMYSCKTLLDFQKAFCYSFLKDLLAKASKGISFDHHEVDTQKRYTFVSNHRDIVLDSALLDVLLIDAGWTTTCEIAIGDNLLKLPWVKDLVRLNKAFIVERDLPIRELLMASKRLSEYMHYAINEKQDNLWIAQREGRAKDSNDHTQPAILKMMTIGGEGSIIDRLKDLHIVPLAISYEYDPCDYLKAREMQLKRDVKDWKKGPMDDVISMQTGIMGYKGHIHYHAAPCIDEWLDTIADTPKTEVYDRIAQHLDHEIFSRYKLYPGNYVALDMLNGNSDLSDHYTEADKQTFEQYVESRIQKIDLPNRDDAFCRERLLEMYANPCKNYLSVKK